jgi:hypothetical protein
MFEGTFAPPFYLDLYGFLDGPQDDIFEDSYSSIPEPGDNQTALPVLANLSRLPVPNLELLGSSFVVPTGTSTASASPTITIVSAREPTPSSDIPNGDQGPQAPFQAKWYD